MSDEHVTEKQGQEEPYRVGYGKPPKEHQWKPGQSGNPGGRKPGSSIVAPLNRLMAEFPNEHGEGLLAVEHAMILRRIVQGEIDPKDAAVRLKAIAMVMERVDGKILQETHNVNEELVITYAKRPEPKEET